MAKKGMERAAVGKGLAEPSLERIANCLAYLVTHTEELRGKPDKDLILILSGLGFERNSIASILRTTPGTVSVCLSQSKTKAVGRKSLKGQPQDQAGA